MQQALALPPEERKRMGAALLDSVDDDVLRETVRQRIAEIERGEAEAHDAMDVYRRLRSTRRD